jgi:glycine/sarcosine N-methyltransferase
MYNGGTIGERYWRTLTRKGGNHMSKFYSEIAKHYDDIFPIGNAQLQLITKAVGLPPKDILDVACGSGGYSVRLSDMGYTLTAVDLDESMIRNLNAKDKTINAQVMNMLHIQELSGTFDLIFCIGNSLVHLDHLQEIGQFLTSCKNKLRNGGKLVLQIINFDRILEKEIKNLPTISNEEKHLRFERVYNYLPLTHKVDFMTVLTLNGEVFENHVLLFPIKSAELTELLSTSGFTSVELYGSFNKDPYVPLESSPLVIVAG